MQDQMTPQPKHVLEYPYVITINVGYLSEIHANDEAWRRARIEERLYDIRQSLERAYLTKEERANATR